jgi:hypothetical protein
MIAGLKARLVMLLLIPLVVFANVLVWVSYLAHIVDNPAKSLAIALMMDQAGNVAINGRVDQSLSQRADIAWKAGKRWGCILCKLLDWVQKNHCEDATR